MLAYQILCLTYKKLYRQVHRVYIIGLRYRHDCDQFKKGIYTPIQNCHFFLYNMYIYQFHSTHLD